MNASSEVERSRNALSFCKGQLLHSIRLMVPLSFTTASEYQMLMRSVGASTNPVWRKQLSLKNVSRHQDRNVVKNSRVLIAVEAALVALELELSLQQSGIETHSVGNVADAIRMIDAKQPDVAIIDSRLGSEDTLGIGRRL